MDSSDGKTEKWSTDFICGIYEGYYLALFQNYEGNYEEGADEELQQRARTMTEAHVESNCPWHEFRFVQLEIDYEDLKRKCKERVWLN